MLSRNTSSSSRGVGDPYYPPSKTQINNSNYPPQDPFFSPGQQQTSDFIDGIDDGADDVATSTTNKVDKSGSSSKAWIEHQQNASNNKSKDGDLSHPKRKGIFHKRIV